MISAMSGVTNNLVEEFSRLKIDIMTLSMILFCQLESNIPQA